jgi:hypothetical protein
MKDIVATDSGINTIITIGDSDNEHIEDLVVFNKDWQKFQPQFGAEAGKFAQGNDKDLKRLSTQIYRNLEADKVKNIAVEIINKKLEINGNY